MARRDGLSGKQKAAILLITLGPNASAEVFKHLSDEEIEDLTLEIANIEKIDPSVKEDVLEEFSHLMEAKQSLNKGGMNYAREVLTKAVGDRKANEILEKLTSSLQVRPFDSIRKAESSQLVNFIQNEHPQTIALVMAYLSPEQSAEVLSSLPEMIQSEVARRIAEMDRTTPEVIKNVEKVLEKKMSAVTGGQIRAGGIESTVNILNFVDRATEKNIIEQLEEEKPPLAEEIKKRMFVFEDIVMLDNQAIQLLLREVDNQDVALSLKTSSSEVQDKIFDNMSKRASSMLKEDMNYMGPVKLRDVEDAQQRIVAEIRRLEDNGEIIIPRGGNDDIVV
ncbi:MAG: flagellar motor switch protein FliG [bacterium]